MPIYEYRCTRCGHQFEVRHAVSETVERCEQCGGSVHRVFSPVGIIFKGPGFHINDYRKTPAPAEGDSKPAGDGKAAAAPSGSGSSDKGAAAPSGSGSSDKGASPSSSSGSSEKGAAAKTAKPGTRARTKSS